MSTNKLKLFHEEIMQEEGLKVTDLPQELQKKIRGFNLMKGKWEKNPVNDRDFISLQKTAVKLGDLVQNFVEQDFDEDEEEQEEEQEEEGKEKKDSTKKPSNKERKKEEEEEEEDNDDDDEKKKTSKSDKSNNPPKDKQPTKTTGKFGNSMMEKKILAIMEAKGENRIRISDLEAIIGREPEYPEQVVNNIKLRKVFLSSEYRLV